MRQPSVGNGILRVGLVMRMCEFVALLIGLMCVCVCCTDACDPCCQGLADLHVLRARMYWQLLNVSSWLVWLC